jgi:hypothetical protein
MKRIALISLLTITVTACADRTRVNCERQRNKALSAVTVLGQIENNLGAKCE